MTNQEKRIYGLMRLVVWKLHKGKCFLSGQELIEPGIEGAQGHPWEIHHIKHQRQHPHMRFDLANVVPLAKTVHDLDHKGELVDLICDKMGIAAFCELNRRANVITRPDLDAVERKFKTILGRS